MSTGKEFESGRDFLGRGWSFPVRFRNSSRSVEMSEGEQDIRESLEILLSTLRGERVMQPDFGTNLHGSVFEPLRTSSAARMTDVIRRAILFHEPRVVMEDVSFRQDREQDVILVTIEYTITATNTRTNIVYPFYLQEGTDL